MMCVMEGPRPSPRTAREALVRSVVTRLVRAEGSALACVALYGSMARGEDGPHSDVELLASIEGRDDHRVDEWLAPAAKVKVHRYGAARLRSLAETVGPEWSLERGKWLQLVTLAGDAAVVDDLRARSAAPPAHELDRAARALLVGELHELVGKSRNASIAGAGATLPAVALRLAEQVTLWLGILRRAAYTSRHLMLAEALAHPETPAGIATLLRRALRGDLRATPGLAVDIERAWDDIAHLAATRLDLAACFACTLPEDS
jgi:kanamycin nucleotidyltransferase